MVGLTGAVAFLAALVVLPWFTVAGEGATLSDIREAFTVAATDPSDVVPGAGEPTASTLPEGSIPTPGEVTDAVTDAAEQQARDAAGDAAAAVIDSGRSRYLELYTDVLWVGVAGIVVAAAVVSTLLAPRSAALSLLLGVRRLAGAPRCWPPWRTGPPCGSCSRVTGRPRRRSACGSESVDSSPCSPAASSARGGRTRAPAPG